jgi:hypothetical protein
MRELQVMRLTCIVLLIAVSSRGDEHGPELHFEQDNVAGKLAVVVKGREVMAYQYGPQHALPHYWPLRSPSGKLLTVGYAEPYPHHRSLWIADHVQADSTPAVDFYHSWKNYRVVDEPESGFRHSIRHETFGTVQASGRTGLVEATLRWIVDETRPILDERRTLRVVALAGGEYFLDLAWELKASHGPVRFLSDDVHYAWPYVRMHPQFSGKRGGTIMSDTGQTGQQGTNGKTAKWIDCSNTAGGTKEGLAVMLYPDGKDHKWLTRDYGTFGPRRADAFSGTRFMLRSDERLNGRVGILIHRGDADSGRVAERYQEYVEGRL